MTRLTRTTLLAAGLCALLAPAEAKKYNQPNGVPSGSQAIINRVYADMATIGDAGGQYGAYESDCSDLDIGANSADGRPDSQVIVADTIINVAGQCRMVRHSGLFPAKEPAAAPKGASRPAAEPKR